MAPSCFRILIVIGAQTTIAAGLYAAPEAPLPAPLIEFQSADQEIAPAAVEVMEDPAGVLSAEEVFVSKSAWQSRPAPLAYGFSDAALWVRLNVRNSTEARGFYLANTAPYIERMELFVFRNGRRTDRAVDGSLLPASQRVRPRSPEPVVYFEIPPGETASLLLRVTSQSSIYFEPILCTQLAYGKSSARRAGVQGLYFGLVGLAFLVNLALYFRTAHRGFLLYCVYLLAAAAYQLAFIGYARVLLWPEAGAWNSRSLVVLGSASFLAVAAFSAHFLALGRRRPWARNTLVALCILIGANAVGGFFGPLRLSDQLTHLLATTTSLFLLFAGVLSWARGLKIARYYIFAWSALLICIVIFNLFATGIIDAPLARHSIQVGTALEMFLFNAALIDRIASAREDSGVVNRTVMPAENENFVPAPQAQPQAQPQAKPRTTESAGRHAVRLHGIDVAACTAELRRLMEVEKVYQDEDLNLKMLARALGIRPDQLSSLLNQELKVSFADFVNRYRVREAHQLLEQCPERGVLWIAFAVGFNTKSAFYEAFRKFTGGSPGELRRRPVTDSSG